MSLTATDSGELETAERLQAQATLARLRGELDAAQRYDERAAHCRRRHVSTRAGERPVAAPGHS